MLQVAFTRLRSYTSHIPRSSYMTRSQSRRRPRTYAAAALR